MARCLPVLPLLAAVLVCGCDARETPELGSEAAGDAGAAAESDAPPQTPPEDLASAKRILLRGARVMTGAGSDYERADVLIAGSRIEAVGPELEAPPGAQVVELDGKTVTPGLIDTHSHIGVYSAPSLRAHKDGNEAVKAVTAYARAGDAWWPQDPQIDLARAGGVTTAQILPGSANLIGGRSIVVKFRPGARSAAEARFAGAPEGLKMACGENPKRVYGEKGGPQTRMGNVAGYRAAFQKAVEYRDKWQKYRRKLAKWEEEQAANPAGESDKAKPAASEAGAAEGDEKKSDEPPDPPALDYDFETLSLVLDGEILVHNHCYRADEMSLMLDLADAFGFQIRSFHHAVEAYKIADRLAVSGTAASMWADWWGFKAEAYDGVRENAAMVSLAGARAIIHSDSSVGIQRLNQEAAKAMYAARNAGFEIDESEVLRWITANPAWALGVEELTGTLEAGKLADIVVWDRTPFSVYAKAERVYIDGELVFDRLDPARQPRTDFNLGLLPGDLGPQDLAPASPAPSSGSGDAP